VPHSRPTLVTLITQAAADVVQYTESVVAQLRGTPEYLLALVQAGLAHGNYGAVAYEAKQTPPREGSSLEATVRWSTFLKLNPPHIKKQPASGQANFTGTDGTDIPALTKYTNPNGVPYETDALVTVSGGVASVNATATRGGADTNADPGTAFTLSQPIPGVDSAGTYEASGGRDDETQPEVLARIHNHFESPNRGGGPGDFVQWAHEQDSTLFAWEFGGLPEIGYTTVIIAAAGLVAPTAQVVSDVDAYIKTKEPIFMYGLVVQAANLQTLAVSVSNGPPDTTTRDAVKTAMEDHLKSIAGITKPGDILDINALENGAQKAYEHLTISSPAVDQDPGEFGVYNAVSITWL